MIEFRGQFGNEIDGIRFVVKDDEIHRMFSCVHDAAFEQQMSEFFSVKGKNIRTNGITPRQNPPGHVFFLSFIKSTNVHIPHRSLLFLSRVLFEHHDMSILTYGLHCVRTSQ